LRGAAIDPPRVSIPQEVMLNLKLQKGEECNSMKATREVFILTLALAALMTSSWAETPASAAPAAKDGAAAPAPPPVTAADVQALKDALAAQQLQIQRLTEQLQRQQAWQAQQSAAEAAAKANVPNPAPQQMADLTTGAPVQQDNPTPGVNPQETQVQPISSPMEGPLTIHFRGINITPGGYAAAEFVRHSRAIAADVQTPFNNLTMPGASQSQVSEFFGSARQSKITTFVDGRMKNVDLSSYVSADFLSAGVTSTSTGTNGYTLRLRQAWGQAKFNDGWSFLGGQMWDLATENGKGISPDDDLGRTNDARPKVIDSNYNVGFTSGRQYGVRLTKDFADKVWLAIAMEESEGTLTTHNNGNNFLIGQPGASNSYNTGATYTFNPSPDLTAKAAFEPGFGHYEIFGIYDRFADRAFPCGEVLSSKTLCGGSTVAGVNALGVYNISKNGGGLGATARWNFFDKHVVFGLKGFGGSGVGRYGVAQLPDLSIHSNGTLDLIKNLQGLSTLEFHTKRFDIDAYTGVEYGGRAADFDPLQKGSSANPFAYVGYGSPYFNNYGCYTELPPSVNTGFAPTTLKNCTGDTRAVIEGTLAFWYRFYSGPRGRFQFGTQYSYVTRQTWSGCANSKCTGPGVSPEGIDNMIFTSFRYYLP
jgi:hypothetical protein